VRKYDASPHTLAIVFFALGILQALFFQGAVRLTGRFGLLRTMVFTHLPSNLLLAAVAFAPNLATAIVLLLSRFALSQMDVPTGQACVMAVVDPSAPQPLLHQHRPLPHQAGRSADRRSDAPRRTRRAVSHRRRAKERLRRRPVRPLPGPRGRRRAPERALA
jgi:hypothetical protein